MKRWAIVFAFALGSVGLAACGGDDDDDTSGDDTTEEDSGGGGGDAVDYVVESIEYTDVTAPAGGTIEIDNQSGAPHTFTADDDSFDFEVVPDGGTTIDAPADPGEYPFHCEIHASMTATLTVE